MLQLMILLTTLLIFITGGTVVGLGNWQPFKLKYAAVVLASFTSIWLFIYMIVPGIYLEREDLGTTYKLIGIARNMSFLLFIYSVGRDSITYKKKDRRLR